MSDDDRSEFSVEWLEKALHSGTSVDVVSALDGLGEYEQLELLLEHLLVHQVIPEYRSKGLTQGDYISAMSSYVQAKAGKLQLDISERQEEVVEAQLGVMRSQNEISGRLNVAIWVLAVATIALVGLTFLNYLAIT